MAEPETETANPFAAFMNVGFLNNLAKKEVPVDPEDEPEKEDPTQGKTDQTDGINKKADALEKEIHTLEKKIEIQKNKQVPNIRSLKKAVPDIEELGEIFRENLDDIDLEEERLFWTGYCDRMDTETKDLLKLIDDVDAQAKAAADPMGDNKYKEEAASLYSDTTSRLSNAIASLKETDKIAEEINVELEEQVSSMMDWQGEFMDLNDHLNKIRSISGKMLCREYINDICSWFLTLTTVLVLIYFICLAEGAFDEMLGDMCDCTPKNIMGETGMKAAQSAAGNAASGAANSAVGGRY